MRKGMWVMMVLAGLVLTGAYSAQGAMINSSWSVLLNDDFEGTPDTWVAPYDGTGGKGYRDAYLQTNWEFNGSNANSMKRSGNGQLELNNPTTTICSLYSKNAYAFSQPTEFYVENVTLSPTNKFTSCLRLVDTPETNQIQVAFRPSDKRLDVTKIVAGTTSSPFSGYYTGTDLTPDISIILDATTLNVWVGGTQVVTNNAHGFSTSVVNAGFKMRPLNNQGYLYETFEKATIATTPEPFTIVLLVLGSFLVRRK